MSNDHRRDGMNSDCADRDKMLLEVAANGPTDHIKRIALITPDSRGSFAVAALRGELPTFVVESLSELRAALTTCFEQRAEEAKDGSNLGMFALDITRLSLSDTALIGESLGSATALGNVYVLTPEQFELFEEGTFDFVVR